MSQRILIVDDSEMTRRILVAIVRSRRQWTVCGEAGDGSSAIRKFQVLLLDLVLVYFSMPDINGIEVARVMDSVDPTIPIIIFTVHDVDALKPVARDAGVYDIVSKAECWNLLTSIDKATAESRGLVQ